MKTVKYAIWAAVSTDKQADDEHFSLEEQVRTSRQAADLHGWSEAVEPYIVPGESRTRWVNLSDAELAIPQLHQLLDDAQAGKYDILVVREFDRFRELLDPVARTLSHYGVQIYSVAQPVEPITPETYNPYASDSDYIMRGMTQIISRAAVASLRRKYYTQMPLRITQRGLPHQIPYGYKKPDGHETDRAAVAVPDPVTSKIVIEIKERFLSGISSSQIARELTARNIPAPGFGKRGNPDWNTSCILRTLQNPFYSGTVRWGSSKVHLDPRTGRTLRKRNKGQVISAPGKHQPLWDTDQQAAIEMEFARRKPAFRGMTTSSLSNLLHCSICGGLLWHYYISHRDDRPGWRCSIGGSKHVKILDSVVTVNLIARLSFDLQNQVHTTNESDHYDEQIARLKSTRNRIGDAYAAGVFSLEEFSRRVQPIDFELQEIETKRRKERTVTQDYQARAKMVDDILEHLDILPEWLVNSAPGEVNRVLQSIYKTITVTPLGEIESVEMA